jgi:signal transduction histidine kinase
MSAKLPARYFRRIIENLVDNAVKFTQEGTVRVLVCGTDAGEVCVEVRDTGVGMAHPEALFAEFKQASEGTKRAHEGSGLGLTIAGRLARLMGGSIEVESTKGEGSCFTVRLPRTLDLDTDDAPSS